MDRPSLPRSVSCAFLVLATLASSTGCTSLLGEKPKGPLGNLDLKGLQAAGYHMGADGSGIANTPPIPEDGRPSVILEVHDGKKHGTHSSHPEKPTFIDDIVKDAQLVERMERSTYRS